MTQANHFNSPLYNAAVPNANVTLYLPASHIETHQEWLRVGRDEEAPQVLFLHGNFVRTAGAGPLDVFLQTSLDEGLTWSDVAHLRYAAASRRSWVMLSNFVTFGAAVLACGDGTLAVDTRLSGVVADLFRIRMDVVAGYDATLRLDLVAR